MLYMFSLRSSGRAAFRSGSPDVLILCSFIFFCCLLAGFSAPFCGIRKVLRLRLAVFGLRARVDKTVWPQRSPPGWHLAGRLFATPPGQAYANSYATACHTTQSGTSVGQLRCIAFCRFWADPKVSWYSWFRRVGVAPPCTFLSLPPGVQNTSKVDETQWTYVK